MRIINKTLIIMFIGLLATSCNEFLEEEPLVAPTEASFFDDELNAVAAINACYDPLTWGQSGLTLPLGFAHGYEWIVGDVLSDDAVKGSTTSDLAGITELEEWRADASNANIATLWYNPFAGIYRTNIVINNIEEGTIPQELKDRLMGEAKFLRAYYYFLQVRIFGGVPLFTTPISPDDIEAREFSRASIGEAYALINQDLKDAIELLPEKSGYLPEDIGRATKGAARAYLARAYMYQIGMINDHGITWDDVYEQTSSIIASGEYGLAPNYATIFEMEGENGVGSIFEVQAISIGQSGWAEGAGTIETVFQNPFGTFGYGFNNPTQDLFDEFNEGDPRREMTLYSEGDLAHGLDIDILAGGRNATGYLHRKVILDPEFQPSNAQESPQNIRKFRYSDILLMQAEAEYYRGNEPNARSLVNEVRERARNSTYPKGYTSTNPGGYEPYPDANVPDIGSNVSGQALLEAIWHERRIEFGMETIRYYDLIRTGRYLSSLEETFGPEVRNNAESHSIMTGVNPVPLLPIPTVDVTAWGIEQNPGY